MFRRHNSDYQKIVIEQFVNCRLSCAESNPINDRYIVYGIFNSFSSSTEKE